MIPETGPGRSPAPAGEPAAAVVESKGPLVVHPGDLTSTGAITRAGGSFVPAPPSAATTTARGSGDALPAGSVQSELDALAGALPPPPPQAGRYAPPWTIASGVPDWGTLKLQDPADQPERYPGYQVPPGPAVDPRPFPRAGMDPQSDWVWNSGVSPLALPGAGSGLALSAGVSAGLGPTVRTLRVVRRWVDPASGKRLDYVPVVVSGLLHPADRGVLALVKWPASGPDGKLSEAPDFVAQPLGERVLAAVLLGQGILPPPPPKPRQCSGCDDACDGSPGGIFDPGRDDDDSYDPLAFPGRASGQYDLREVLLGVDSLEGLPLRKPFDDYDADGKKGAQRAPGATWPAAGQVRLGTDGGAGPVLPYGIPIFGASASGYAPPPAPEPSGQVLLGANVLLTARGDEPNFLAYRLPQLADYATLPYTPRGMDVLRSRETFRFFDKKLPAASLMPDGSVVPAVLPTAGLYGGLFRQDGWSRQVARYRHAFLVPAAGTDLLRSGTYWLMHFRTEGAFEKFALTGLVDAADLYGARAADTKRLGSMDNVSNFDGAGARPPRGPAPAYGHTSSSYHLVRAEVSVPAEPVTPPSATGAAKWSAATNPPVTWVSGVAYYVPTDPATGDSVLGILSLDLQGAAGVFETGVFGVDDARTLARRTPPAVVAPPCPVVVSVAAFGWGDHPSRPGEPSVEVPVGAGAPAALTSFAGSAGESRLRRVEVPLPFCGQNGRGTFGDANAPDAGDALTVSCTTAMPLRGDLDTPSFSTDARARAFVRARHDGTLWPDDKGVELVLDPPARLLLHTGGNFGPAQPRSGNYTTGAAAPYGVPPSLASTDRDREERFLDEVYRWTNEWAGVDGVYDYPASLAVSGPGLGAWRPSYIPLPVRVAHTTGWQSMSWVRQGRHLEPLKPGHLQVAGLPHRVPSAVERAAYPHPSAGLVRYPGENYAATGVRPSKADDGLPVAQPDYTKAAGPRAFVRALDMGYEYVGRSVVAIRVDGVDLRDIEYAAPGPGGRGVIAVHVKVPGLTTWMDAGRRDGSGPGKQSPTEDGAGCLIHGPGTRSGVDPDSGLVYCRLHLNLGDFAALRMSGFLEEVPLLVRVTMTAEAAPFDLSHPKNPFTGTFGPPSVTAPNLFVRGVAGIRRELP